MPICIVNGSMLEQKECDSTGINAPLIYEVVRIIEGEALFLDDHLSRLSHSFLLAFPNRFLDATLLKVEVMRFLNVNAFGIGNFRIEVSFVDKLQYKIFPIFYDYPSAEQYLNGVKLVTQHDQRSAPNAKIFHQAIKARTTELLQQQNVYETLLINKAGKATEGSRSNVFWIDNNTLISAPEHDILLGITRKHLLILCQKLGIDVISKSIDINDIHLFQSAFLCGTSPMILPIYAIDNVQFEVQHPLLRKLMIEFDNYVFQSLQ